MCKTLKQNRLTKNDFAEFIELYCADDLSRRQATWSEDNPEGRWRSYDYADLTACDKTNLDIFWLKDSSLEDSENLPAPEVLATEIVEQLQAALDEFKEVEALLN
jgi:type I restriction enzyme M protein